MQRGVINMKCELVDPDGLLKQLRVLKSVNVDGIMVDCWWGIVEAHAPQEYNWSGYKRLFQMVREVKLKLQVHLLKLVGNCHGRNKMSILNISVCILIDVNSGRDNLENP